MISRLSSIITEALLKAQVIEEADRELYVYGFFVLLSQGLFFLISVLFGCIFGTLCESIVFYFMFSTLRCYAGGFHASKESVCTCCTTAALFLAELSIWTLTKAENILLPLCTLVLCSAVVYLQSPLDSEDKPLSYIEFCSYRRKSRTIVVGVVIIAIIGIWASFLGILYAATSSMVLESFLLGLERIVRKTKHNSY